MTSLPSNNNTKKSNPRELKQSFHPFSYCNNNTKKSNPREQTWYRCPMVNCNNNTKKSNPQELNTMSKQQAYVITIQRDQILKNAEFSLMILKIVITIQRNQILKNPAQANIP